MTDDTYAKINGHIIDLEKFSIDQFFSGEDGAPVTDEEWDISAERIKTAEALGDDYQSWVPVADWNGDGGDLGSDEE